MFSEKVLLIVKNFKKILEDLVEDEDMLYNGIITKITLPFGGSRIYLNEVILYVNSSTDYSFTHRGEKTTFKYPILHPKFEFELCKYFNTIEMMIYDDSIESRILSKKYKYVNEIQKAFSLKQEPEKIDLTAGTPLQYLQSNTKPEEKKEPENIKSKPKTKPSVRERGYYVSINGCGI
jgi:hypothetical protein